MTISLFYTLNLQTPLKLANEAICYRHRRANSDR